VGRFSIFLWGTLLFLFTLLPEANGFEIKGFADVTFTKGTLKGDPTENGSFALGPIDLYVSELLTDRIELLSEMALEDGGVDIERLQIGYIFNDALKIRAGRFHNALGYWNQTYHHGALMQTSIDRPFFLKFEDEGGLLPVHTVGLWAAGRHRIGPGVVGYDLMVGNGPRIDLDPVTLIGDLDPNNGSDDNKNKVLAFRLQASPLRLPLTVMVFGNIGKVNGYAGSVVPLLDVDQSILGAALAYDNERNGLEFLSEIYWVKDKDKLTGLGSNTNTLYYLQAGYTFMERLTPYVRYEQALIEESDPYMTALAAADTRRALAGIRFDLAMVSALKIEGRRIHRAGVEDHSEYAVQWAFSF
jgi:hypothetical protein